jgi:hypothetical protein
MSSTAKISVAVGHEELAWARAAAKRRGKSLSAVVTEALAEQKRLDAMRDVLDWLSEGAEPLTPKERAAARRALRSCKR